MSIAVDRLVKSYDEHVVVNQVSLEVADGECFVLLGPSGSGKSTVLRIVAGLTPADAGRVLLNGRDVTRMPPQRRGVGMVFQQYALFAHMTVADNVEFPLRIRKVGRRERARRRDELLELVGLVGFAGRFPHQLSGGQQQRVAIARALAHRPEVLLLDEPFGALDARIRGDLRKTLRRIQREIRVTTIFVTHDQDEAFELADRMAVMNFGRLLETGSPDELYLRPQTEFVASFLGRANLFVGRCLDDQVHLGDAHFRLDSRGPDGDRDRRVQVLFRPEDVAVKLTRDALEYPTFGQGVVEEAEFSGSIERLRIRIPAIPGVRPIAPAVPFGADYMLLDSTRSQHLARRFPLAVGDRAWVGVRRIHALAHQGLSFACVQPEAGRETATFRYADGFARRCCARVTPVAFAGDAEAVLRELGLRPHDVVLVAGSILDGGIVLEALLSVAPHHVLAVPEHAGLPTHVLLCTAAGEPAKHDLVAAGRIIRHLGVPVTVLTAVPDGDSALEEQISRFHEASIRTLCLYGIRATAHVRSGAPEDVIPREVARLGCDLVVLGSARGVALSDPAIRLRLRHIARAIRVPTLFVQPSEGL